MFTDWPLARQLRAALALFSLLLLLAVVVIVLVLRQADQATTRQTQRILPARDAAAQLLTALVDQETGLRGYALTHKRTYLRPYAQGLADEQQARARLGRLISPHDQAQLDLLSVDAAVTAWRQEYAELRLQDVLQGTSTTTIEFGRQLFDRVRQTNADLDASLAVEARAAQQEADHDRRLVATVLVVLAVVVALALVALQRGLRRAVLRPMRSLAGQVAVVSAGTYDHELEVAGPAEIRTMSQGVESMRRELVRALADVEDRKRELERRATELARSNADLEQFAYVASHDLQEPLRKVASFCQLIEQRYGGQLDERGEQYIAFAVDGAKRMQGLITDLLTFSRVGRTSEGFVPVELDDVIRRAWREVESRVRESGAELDADADALRVLGDANLLQLLLGNLFGNALKYSKKDATPRVQVRRNIEGPMVRVDVADNGIGIPEEYAEKVFVIFQRLHARDEYEGTGIGLALCKKIVEFHGGDIELRPSPLGGTNVSFTLPLEVVPAHV